MANNPKDKHEIETDRSPEEAARARNDILKRMLHTKPKQHREIVKERKGKRAQPKKGNSAGKPED